MPSDFAVAEQEMAQFVVAPLAVAVAGQSRRGGGGGFRFLCQSVSPVQLKECTLEGGAFLFLRNVIKGDCIGQEQEQEVVISLSLCLLCPPS